MGISISCPFASYSDVESSLESIIVKSISFGDEEVKTPVRSVSFNKQDMEPTILKSLGSGKMVKERSVSFKESELEALISRTCSLSEKEKDECIRSIRVKVGEADNPSPRPESSVETFRKFPISDPHNPKHEAALKLQKVYKSFRTRRKLADCAVLVEQSWWKLLDFAELKRSSISFFDIEKHETAISRWSRARTRAAKVGKGLSKNDKAQKLALQHWLEAIDPRHRYGHNLHYYYENWLHCQSREPFFYWLDIGEGREVNIIDKCPRWKLQQQCIKYLGPMERKAYEVVVKNGKFFYKQMGAILDTMADVDSKWIFVLSTAKTLYVGKKKKGSFQHSSFLAGGATTAAGRLIVERGELKAVWPHSGHYRPTEQNFKDLISFLQGNNVDLTDVKMSPVDEEEASDGKQRYSMHIRNNSSVEDLMQALDGLETDKNNIQDLSREKPCSAEDEANALPELPNSAKVQDLTKKLPNIAIPKRNEMFERQESTKLSAASLTDVYEIVKGAYAHASGLTHMDSKKQLLHEDLREKEGEEEEEEEEAVPEEAILQRINSRKKSYQLGKQLSCKWTTGAGPRIGCVRDYPSQLQFRALERLNLSPTSTGYIRSRSSPHTVSGYNPLMQSSTCSGFKLEATASLPVPGKGNCLDTTIHHGRIESSPLHRRILLDAVESYQN